MHTSLISLDLNEPPLFFALKALQRRSQKEDEDIGPTRVPIPKQMIMEFGVGAGHTLKKIKEFFPVGKTIVGFDSFEGLPKTGSQGPGAKARSLRAGRFQKIFLEKTCPS